MKRAATLLFAIRVLQVLVVLIGIGVLAFMLWEPHIEGRNVHATLFEIYFNDPFLAYAYVASIPFFVALHRAFMVLEYVGQSEIHSQPVVNALRTIQSCAILIIGFVAVGELFFVLDTSEDRAGGVFMGILITFGSIVAAVGAAMLERKVQSALERRSQNAARV